MNWFIKLISNPLKRCGLGFLMILVFGPLSAVLFPPLMIFALLGVLLFLTLGEAEKALWFDTEKTEECVHCNTSCKMKAVKLKHYMQVFFPFPILVKIFSLIKIPYNTTYYVVCSECMAKHVEGDNFNAIRAVANGEMATVRQITMDEFKILVPQEK